MASLITAAGFAQEVNSPLELFDLQTLVGGFVKFVDIGDGRMAVVNEMAVRYSPVNEMASNLAGCRIHGDVVICSGEEIA